GGLARAQAPGQAPPRRGQGDAPPERPGRRLTCCRLRRKRPRGRKDAQIMNAKLSRRKLIQAASAAALPFPCAAATTRSASRRQGTDTPKIWLEVGAGRLAAGALDDAGARRVKQLGVDHVIGRYAGRIPWQEDKLKELIDRLKGHGLALGNIMLTGF